MDNTWLKVQKLAKELSDSIESLYPILDTPDSRYGYDTLFSLSDELNSLVKYYITSNIKKSNFEESLNNMLLVNDASELSEERKVRGYV